MTRQKANSLENIPWSELGKRNIPAKKVYFSWVLRVPREIEDNGYHAKFFRGGGGGGLDVNKVHYRASVKYSIALLLSYFHT